MLSRSIAPESLADISLARRLLSYEPAVSFEDGLRRTIDHLAETSIPGLAKAG